MRTSNPCLLDEIDTLEEIKRVDAKELEVVKEIDKLRAENEALRNLNSIELFVAYCLSKEDPEVYMWDLSDVEDEIKKFKKLLSKDGE